MNIYNFSITREPQYLAEQSSPNNELFCFAYTITITNTGSIAAQLISRHWLIHEHASGQQQEVAGLGVVGQQPLLQPGESFQYTSGCNLASHQGSMQGEFFFVAVDGHRFEIKINPFVLEAQAQQDSPRYLH